MPGFYILIVLCLVMVFLLLSPLYKYIGEFMHWVVSDAITEIKTEYETDETNGTNERNEDI